MVHSASRTSQKVTLPPLPELYDPNFLDTLLPLPPKPSQNASSSTPKLPPAPTNPMIEALRSTTNRTYTLNGADAYSTTDSPTLDAFQGIGPWSHSTDLDRYLGKAWEEDPELTLRIIWNLRSIHDGKSAKEAFYRAFGWLYSHHPRTAISNLDQLVLPLCRTKKTKKHESKSHGYWKDLLNILALATLDQLHSAGSPGKSTFLHSPKPPRQHRKRAYGAERVDPRVHNQESKARARDARLTRAENLHATLYKKLENPTYRALYIAIARLFATQIIKDLNIALTANHLPPDTDRVAYLKQISLASKWAPSPCRSHDRVTNVASAIALVVNNLRHSFPPSFRFPSAVPASASTNANSLGDMPLETDEPHLHTLRSFYQRHILTPLRDLTQITETRMTSNRWSQIQYTRVPAVCMKNNTKLFCKHDMGRFEEYLVSVESQDAGSGVGISGATLLPHVLLAEILKEAEEVRGGEAEEGYHATAAPGWGGDRGGMKALRDVKKKIAEMKLRVLEAQWSSLLSRLRESGSLDNCIAVCDVSGSMGSIHTYTRGGPRSRSHKEPILPALSLTLLISQLSLPPFQNAFITFSESPQFITLDPSLSIAQNVQDIVRSSWGMNTDFKAVFLRLILPLAVQHGIKREDMIKRIYVFSDMQFDNASSASANYYSALSPASKDQEDNEAVREWRTNHDVIEKAYREAGYDIPQIVYWNLAGAGSATKEVESGDREGVAMMSGFSPGMFKVFVGEEEDDAAEAEKEEGWEVVGEEKKVKEEEDKFTPVNVMRKALGRESYRGLVVVD